MKKVLIVLSSLVVIIVLAGILVPIIFKDEIKAKIDEELNKTLNATVVFDTDDFGLSVFKNFPNVTASMTNFGIINKEPFEGEILFAVEGLDVEVNIADMLFGDELRIKGIFLNHPEINILVDEDGNANYDIYIASEEETPVEEVEETSEADGGEDLSFGIDHWEITNAHFVYEDVTMPVRTELKGLNHRGSGDFTLSIFDLSTYTTIDTIQVTFDGVNYLKNQSIMLDATLGMDLDAFKFTFKENTFALNDFAVSFDGWFAMPEDGFDMDITYGSQDNSFKSLLSMVPAIYLEGFEELESRGSLSFDGYVKGKYTEEKLPSFAVNLGVEDGYMHYPDLPAAIENVGVKMLVENTSGDAMQTLIDIQNFHMDFGNNPFDGSIRIENLINYPVNADVNGKLDLTELGRMFPMEGTEYRGTLEIIAKANGVYDSIANTIPTLDLEFLLTDGYVNSSEAPFPLEEIQVISTIINKTGKINDTEIKVEPFSAVMAGEKIESHVLINNLDDAKWNVSIDGTVDLEKMMPAINEIYPMPGVTLVGLIEAKGQTEGKMSDLEAERYARMPTSGSFKVSNFNYVDEELLPQGFGINSAEMALTPAYISLSSFDGNIGKSDLALSGRIENYMNYVFNEGILRGNLSHRSNTLDLNEWMTEEELDEDFEEDTDTEEAIEEDFEVIPIPTDINFVLTSNINRIIYDNMTLNNANGKITVKDGEVLLDGFSFNMLGGTIEMTGKYNTHDVDHPYFDYNLDVKSLSIAQSYSTFNTVQQMAPIARNITGDYSTQFSLAGNLDDTMMPDYATLVGGGLVKIAQATLTGSKIMAGVNSLTNQANPDNVALTDILMSATVKDGRFSVKPFDVKIGNYKSNVSGSNGLDGTLDYKLEMEIPAGEIGKQVNKAISSLTGGNNTSSTLKLNFGIGGTYDDPKPTLLSASTADGGVKQVIAQEVKEEAINVLQDKVGDDIDVSKIADTEAAKEEVKSEIDTAKKEVDAIAKAQSDSLKKALLEGDKAAADKAIKDAQDKVKNLFKKKKKKKDNN